MIQIRYQKKCFCCLGGQALEWASRRGDGVAIPGGVQEAPGSGTGGCALVVQGLQGQCWADSWTKLSKRSLPMLWFYDSNLCFYVM